MERLANLPPLFFLLSNEDNAKDLNKGMREKSGRQTVIITGIHFLAGAGGYAYSACLLSRFSVKQRFGV